MFLSRSATGSMPSAFASSSIARSSAKAPSTKPGARKLAMGDVFVIRNRSRVRTFAHA